MVLELMRWWWSSCECKNLIMLHSVRCNDFHLLCAIILACVMSYVCMCVLALVMRHVLHELPLGESWVRQSLHMI